MNFTIKFNNPNYLAKIVRINNFLPCPNADKLKIAIVAGNQIITGLLSQDGGIFVYFPLECCINQDYLSWSNSFSDPQLNADKNKKGFFNNGRVKAVKLRGNKSEGYIVPLSDIQEWLKSIGKDFGITEDLINKDFDSFDDVLICEKYVNRQELIRLQKENRTKNKKVVRVSKIIDNQFRLSQDVEQLGRNLKEIEPEDIISITSKLHGCLSPETIVNTREFGDISIGEIINKNLRPKVKSFNVLKNTVSYETVLDAFILVGEAEWLEIELDNGMKIQITKDHPVWSPELNCYRRAGDLSVKNSILTE